MCAGLPSLHAVLRVRTEPVQRLGATDPASRARVRAARCARSCGTTWAQLSGAAVSPVSIAIALQLHLVDDPNHSGEAANQLLCPIHVIHIPHVTAQLHHSVFHLDVHMSIEMDPVGAERGLYSGRECLVGYGLLR